MDFVLASWGILLLAPLLMVLTIMLLVYYRGNPFFFQKRAGYKGRIFLIWKFKTMHDLRDRHGAVISDKDRLHPLGRFMRKLSLDELPQLFNVWIGDMSLIGPRPLLPEYLPYYTEEQMRRHEVRPGITGWAQVNGRNAVKFSQRFAYDVWYVEHLSFNLDCKIVWLTVKNAFVAVETTKLEFIEDIDDLGIGRDLANNYRKNAKEYSTL